ncbi:hypothetical protein H0266_18190 [Halobacillus locisalis]|uniref:Uncharacterized protein n=1 Tax=Halobacillus locisalis TaxID=220753 RepID=A0A838CXE2_9BACI|nr:hypothetical protein [Halobacillus locisalis]MBA2176812.1 hypothetical protein [Halobacillus locisalis]
MKTQKTFKYNDENIPYYHFVYQGDFSHVIHRKKRIPSHEDRIKVKNRTELASFLIDKTIEQFDFPNYQGDYPHFNEAVIVIIHSFTDLYTRDLDNFYYKPIIDVIKHTGIIKDDTWDSCSLTNFGKNDTENKIQAFVIPHSYYPHFFINEVEPELNKLFEKQTKIETRAMREEKIQKEKTVCSFFFDEE